MGWIVSNIKVKKFGINSLTFFQINISITYQDINLKKLSKYFYSVNIYSKSKWIHFMNVYIITCNNIIWIINIFIGV